MFEGLSARGFITQFWLNTESGSWTVIAKRPDGMSCLLDSGEYGSLEKAKVRGVGREEEANL